MWQFKPIGPAGDATANRAPYRAAVTASAGRSSARDQPARQSLDKRMEKNREMTWGRKTGGRKKGTPNKIKKPPALMAEAQAEVAAAVSANEGLQPLEYMLAVMRDPTASEARRDMMAKAAAPYRHPQLQAVAHKHLNADGSLIAPVVNLTVMQPPAPPPQLTSVGPKSDDTVQ
jgi:hypothetical protein